MTIIGFTGTGDGMTERQRMRLDRLLTTYREDLDAELRFHHGDCIGADAEAHDLATGHGFETHVHPPSIDKARAFKLGDVMYPLKPYLKRNDDIVAACNVLIATPGSYHELTRSGTWYTIRKARAMSKPHIIIYPDGTWNRYGLGAMHG